MVVTLISQRLRRKRGKTQSQELREGGGNIKSCGHGGNVPVKMQKTSGQVSRDDLNHCFQLLQLNTF